MTMKVTRRDLLGLAGGGAVGIMLTPAPWKLVDDLAIWTQNWSWIPRPPKGPETLVATACSLCPAGCPIDARCIGGFPVSLRAAGGGALCPLGVTGHHLAYHPARLTAPVRVERGGRARRTTPVSIHAVVAVAAKAMREAAASDATVAVLDMRPGRSVSWAWRRMLGELPHASVLGAPGREGASLARLASMAGARGALGLDLSASAAILSFGAPLAESPELAGRILRNEIRLIQVEPVRSGTADAASRWLPCRPAFEGALALGLANVLLAEGLVDAERVRAADGFPAWIASVEAMTPDAAAASTGIAAATIRETARELAAARPVLVIAGEQPGGGRHGAAAESAIFSLDVLLGGLEGGALVERAELPPPFDATSLAPTEELERLEDGSVALLIVDASAGDATFPWPLAQRKLAPGAPVIALSPFLAGTAANADYIAPTLPFLESLQELPPRVDAPAATFALSVPILPPREGATDPAAFIRELAEAAEVPLTEEWASSEDLARRRVARIHSTGRGSIADRSGATSPLAAFTTDSEVWDALAAGARWVDDPSPAIAVSRIALAPAPQPGFSVTGPDPARLALLPLQSRDIGSSAAISPVLTKLYRESGLRRAAGTAVVNPATAKALGLRDGRTATMQTESGSMRVTLATDETVMPGVVVAIVGPEPDAMGEGPPAVRMIDLCPTDSDGSWRQGSARLMEG